jgi:hypothetical protein
MIKHLHSAHNTIAHNTIAHSTAILLLSASLGGCANNTLRLDRATSMTEAGREATQATMTLMDDAVKLNRAAITEIAVFDPNCTLPQPRIQIGRDSTGKTKLCPDGDDNPRTIAFTRLTKKDLLPTLVVIESVTGYLDAVDEIVNREPLDLVGKLSKAKGELLSIKADITTIAGLHDPAVPELSEVQTTAINQSLALIQVLIDEANRVGDLRKMELRQDKNQFSENITALNALNDRWSVVSSGMLASEIRLLKEQYRRSPPADFAVRRSAVTHQLNLLTLRDEIADLNIELKKLNSAFELAHSEYIDLLFNKNAKLSAAEKRKKSELIRGRVRAALASLASLVRAF